MEIEFKKDKIIFSKNLNKLDELAILFSKILSEHDIPHVFLSGYIAILFGRNRASEDIDVVCEVVPWEKYNELWEDLYQELECIITDDINESFTRYLMARTAVRFSIKNELIPNIELKFARTELHRRAINDRIYVDLNGNNIPISPLELQIAYKLYLGSEKDIEDARFLFKLFEEHLNKHKLIDIIKELDYDLDKARTYLGWSY